MLNGPGIVGVVCSLVVSVRLPVFSRGLAGVLDGAVVVGMRRVRLLRSVVSWREVKVSILIVRILI